MKRFHRGLQQGLNESLEGSGIVLGMLLPLLLVILVIAAVVSWRQGCFTKSGPTTCVDYSFKSGLLDDNAMSCTRWPAMKMSVNERWIKADIVSCKCTEASFPKPEKR